MRFFEGRKPNVKSLVKAGTSEGLIEASLFRQIETAADGATVDAGAPVREEAVLALGNVFENGDGPAIVSRLSEALTDPVERVRCAAVVTLYRLGEAGPLATALPQLPLGKGMAGDIATRALVELRAPGSATALAAALLEQADGRALRDSDAELLSTLLGDDPGELHAVIDLAVAALADERSAVASRAEELLVRLAPASLDVLVEELERGNAAHRAAAVLGRMSDPRAVGPLVAALGHADPRVRAECCTALGGLRDPATAEPLLVATRDSDYEVRVRAGEALDRLGTAAIAVSVAALLQPYLGSPSGRRKPQRNGRGARGRSSPGGRSATQAERPADTSADPRPDGS